MAFYCFRHAQAVAGHHGDAPAILQGDQAVSFTQLVDRALRWATLLDIAPGERVILSAPNSIDLAAAVLGCWARGAIPVFVHVDAPDSHLAHAARLTGAAAIIGGGRAGLDPIPLSAPDRQPFNPRTLPHSCEDPASILFTSGSTGLPKGVVQSARNLIDGATRIPAHLGIAATDRLLCPVPFAFDYGWGQLLGTLFNGTTLILPEAPGGLATAAAIARHSPTVIAAVPAVLADLLTGLAPVRDTDLSSIRLVTNTGSRIPDPVFAALLDAVPQARISLNYGLTETWRSASLPPDLARSHPRSVGHAVPGVSLAVLTPEGREAALHETGEIVHCGAGTFLGYWAEPERTALVRRPDPLWPHAGIPAPPAVFTGDLGWKDEQGLLYVEGRRDRQIKSMGIRVSPDEIEALILESSLVREAAIVARPHNTLGQMVVAIVAPDDPAPLKALKQHARATMSPAMQPRDWLLLPQLPRLPSGKVDYVALARLVAA